MTKQHPAPGVSRENRISNDGLQRLEKHLAAGTKISRSVLAQWIRRYGDSAREIIKRYGRYCDEFDELS